MAFYQITPLKINVKEHEEHYTEIQPISIVAVFLLKNSSLWAS